MIRLSCMLALVCLLTVPAAAASIEDQVQAIARELMCPVCSGQTVAESNSTLAQQMREEIRQRLERGESREQILAFFVGQFGESVLATPPARGAGLVVWIAPVVMFLVGLGILIRFLQQARRPPDHGNEARGTGHEAR